MSQPISSGQPTSGSRSAPGGRDERSARMAAWIDSPAEHAQAAEAIATLGEAAIPALRRYLDRGPQVIPQPRCFAVAMLARLHADAATAALRGVLQDHPLRSLSPVVAESEYVVKCAALDALVTRAYPALVDDIATGLHERLRAAVVAARGAKMAQFADTLVGMLDDDVLDADAMRALASMGPAAGIAITRRLDAWLIEAQDNARRRLAVIRALRVLHCLKTPADAATRRAVRDPHPAVRAAAALWTWPKPHGDAAIERLVRGAVGFDWALADDCRTVLSGAGPGLCAAAKRALRRNAEPDLYGQMRPLASEQRDWLETCLPEAGDA